MRRTPRLSHRIDVRAVPACSETHRHLPRTLGGPVCLGVAVRSGRAMRTGDPDAASGTGQRACRRHTSGHHRAAHAHAIVDARAIRARSCPPDGQVHVRYPDSVRGAPSAAPPVGAGAGSDVRTAPPIASAVLTSRREPRLVAHASRGATDVPRARRVHPACAGLRA